MSMFPGPDYLQSDLNDVEKMNENLTNAMPKEMASAINLFVHPAAGAAAMSALGVGLASQAFGMWLGALTGAAEASQRLMQPLTDDGGAGDRFSAPASKARATAKTLMAEAQSFANEINETETKAAATVARDAKTEAAVEAPIGSELMPEDFRQPTGMGKPAMPDDLKAISGIGPKLETVLNGLGIWTFGQIAAWNAQEIAWMDDTLGFKGRIDRDGWTKQAAALSGGQVKH